MEHVRHSAAPSVDGFDKQFHHLQKPIRPKYGHLQFKGRTPGCLLSRKKHVLKEESRCDFPLPFFGVWGGVPVPFQEKPVTDPSRGCFPLLLSHRSFRKPDPFILGSPGGFLERSGSDRLEVPLEPKLNLGAPARRSAAADHLKTSDSPCLMEKSPSAASLSYFNQLEAALISKLKDRKSLSCT